jgi:hypothetical protein
LLPFGAESFFLFQVAIKNIKVKIYITIVFTFILYGCGTWSLTLREERTLRLFKNRVRRRIFGPKRDKVTEKEKATSRGRGEVHTGFW